MSLLCYPRGARAPARATFSCSPDRTGDKPIAGLTASLTDRLVRGQRLQGRPGGGPSHSETEQDDPTFAGVFLTDLQ